MSDNGIKIEVVRSADRLISLQDDWIRLAKTSPENSIYNQPKLLRLWWDYFGGEPQRPILIKRGINLAGEACGTESLYVLVAYIENKVVAILPLMLLEVRPHGETGLLKCLTFLGDYIFNPIPAIACQEEVKKYVFDSFANFLNESREWDAIFLTSVRRDYESLQQFLGVLKNNIPGKVIHTPLQEERFLNCWDREKIIRKIRSLHTDETGVDEIKAIMCLSEEIEQVSDAEFRKKCLSYFTPRLKSILNAHGQKMGKSNKGIISDIYYEISQTVPYIYQLIHLPDQIKEFEGRLSQDKRYSFRKEKKYVLQLGLKLMFQKNISEEDFLLFVKYHRQRHPHSVHLSEQSMGYYRDLLQCLSIDNSLVWVMAHDKYAKPVYFLLCFYDIFTKSMDYVIAGGEIMEFNLLDYCIVSAIENAIEMKCAFFSFRMGAEEYKGRFHPAVIPLECFIISRNTTQNFTNIVPRHWSTAGIDGK